jgi:hypothetical protein
LAATCWVGCATQPPLAAHPTPLLRLSPSSLGKTLSLRQHLNFTVVGKNQQLDALLETDTTAIRLALFSLGQTAARLSWDGQKLEEFRAPWWPPAVSSVKILSDLQLVLWPTSAIQANLPPGCTLVEHEQARLLKEGTQVVATVQYLTPTRTVLTNVREGYRLQIDSQTVMTEP